jgi:hypothetical protein
MKPYVCVAPFWRGVCLAFDIVFDTCADRHARERIRRRLSGKPL